MVICDGCGVQCFSDLCCPKCIEYAKKSFFCTQLCFDTSWRNHSKTHKFLLERQFYPPNSTETDTHPAVDAPSNEAATNSHDRIIHRNDHTGRQEHLDTNFTEVNIPREGTDTTRTRADALPSSILTHYTIPTSLDNIESLKIYDPESHVLEGDQKNVTKWLVDAAAKLSHTLDRTENLHRMGGATTGMGMTTDKPLGMSASRAYSSYKFKRRFRRVVITLVFSLILFLSFIFSTKLVEIIDARIANKFNTLANFKDENAVEKFFQTTEELRKEILKLREQVYKNAVAINGLTDGAYKVSGGDDAAKKSKFDRNGTLISLSNNATSNQNINRQTIQPSADRQPMEIPDAIEYDASITQQF